MEEERGGFLVFPVPSMAINAVRALLIGVWEWLKERKVVSFCMFESVLHRVVCCRLPLLASYTSLDCAAGCTLIFCQLLLVPNQVHEGSLELIPAVRPQRVSSCHLMEPLLPSSSSSCSAWKSKHRGVMRGRAAVCVYRNRTINTETLKNEATVGRVCCYWVFIRVEMCVCAVWGGFISTSWWITRWKTQLPPSLPPNYFRRGGWGLPAELGNNQGWTVPWLRGSVGKTQQQDWI